MKHYIAFPVGYDVYVTPPSGVGGEWPYPARRNLPKAAAQAYAAACKEKGIKARLVRTPK